MAHRWTNRLFSIAMKRPPPISCSLYDYIEVACLHKYDVKLTVANGIEHIGRATSTRAGPDKVEYFGIHVDDDLVEVPMHVIVRMETITPAALFKWIDFQTEVTDLSIRDPGVDH